MFRWAKRRRRRTKDVATVQDAPKRGGGSGGVFGEPPRAATDAYFGSMSEMLAAIAERDYEVAAVRARKMLAVIPGWVEEEKARAVWAAKQRERWDIGRQTEPGAADVPLLPPSIPVFQQGGTILALVGDEESLRIMANLVKREPELRHWTEKVEDHLYNLNLFAAIVEAVGAHPNCLQPDVKKLVGEKDGRRVANLIAYLEKGGKIVRVREGRTYRLLPADSEDLPAAAPPPPPVASHRADALPAEPHPIGFSSLDYVPLPPSPSQWDATAAAGDAPALPETKDHFAVLDAEWTVQSVENIPFPQRPDPAFRRMYPNDSGLLAIDDLGNAQGMEDFPAAALRYDRTGSLAAKTGLRHGLYRRGVHPLGTGLIAMSKECVLHAYGERLEPILETALDQHPEIQSLRRRFDIPDDQLKNHIRCVALSQRADRYLVTAADEAWCIDLAGVGIWAVRFPNKEPREYRLGSIHIGTSREVQEALDVMDLTMPFTPHDLKRRYRQLARRHHPDLNPRTRGSGETMAAINHAAEVLTGTDAAALRQGATVTIDVQFGGSEQYACDWVYAAAFAAGSDAAYVASYSGRVVLVDDTGKPQRVYDIGSVPTQIIDTGDYLYLLTGTRLYVIQNNALCALVDTYEKGTLVVAQTGFGLLQNKRFRWYHEDGRYLGSVLTKAPIRRVHSKGDTMTVETRQRRATIQGVPTWWE